MMTFVPRLSLLLFGLVLLGLPLAVGATTDLKQLIRDIEQQYMGVSSQALMQMEVSTSNWQRSLEMESWSLGRDLFLVRIIEPAKERGVATLKRNREVWNYLPKVDRTIKVPPSMMGGSWMGSHITNDDLVKANHIEEDYDLALLEESDRHSLIECLPKPDAPVVWGKIVYLVGKQPRVPRKIDYFDEQMVLVRTMTFEDVRQIGDRIVPLKLSVLPHDKPDEKTVMHYRELVYDIPLEESFFSLRSLTQR
ncbi:MAG: outer membrane lipoprotein-sorting protein [Desulfuromonadales bacterium]|nr:outer membrane lipoprotein-sorting protein [Desulfuromonadales bacterium]